MPRSDLKCALAQQASTSKQYNIFVKENKLDSCILEWEELHKDERPETPSREDSDIENPVDFSSVVFDGSCC